MIRTFSYEDYKVLEKYEEHLVRAKFGRYIYALRRPAFEELSAVYRSLGYTQRLDYSCSSCLLNLCITLGNYYFPFKKQLEAEQKNEQLTEEVNEQITEEVKPTTTKKTNGSKAKKTNNSKKTKN